MARDRTTGYNIDDGLSPSNLIFQCNGTEKTLFDCPQSELTQGCYHYYKYGITCTGRMAAFHFSSRDNLEVSTLEHVFMDNISGIQVSGTPPVLQHLTLTNSHRGIVFIGAGITKEKDIFMSYVTITKVNGCILNDYEHPYSKR